MKLSCEQWLKLCKEETEQNAECQECECRFEFNPDLLKRWE
jgi:hypothetical protein